MNAVTPVSTQVTAADTETDPPPVSSTATPDLDYNSFLELLVAQLKNQDPTAPTDSTQFMAQLASFSEVEQSIQANAKLDSLLTSSALSLADAVIGKTVTSADGKTSGIVVSVKITSDGPIATLKDGTTVTLGPGVVIS